MDEDINTRIFSAVYHSLRQIIISKDELPTATKLKNFKPVYIPTLIFNRENQILNATQRSEIEKMEIKFLGGILGKPRNEIRSAEIIRPYKIKSKFRFNFNVNLNNQNIYQIFQED